MREKVTLCPTFPQNVLYASGSRVDELEEMQWSVV